MSSFAQESSEQLSREAANPLADLMSFPFQNNLDFGLGEFDRTRNVLNIQPVIPLAGGKIITRTIENDFSEALCIDTAQQETLREIYLNWKWKTRRFGPCLTSIIHQTS